MTASLRCISVVARRSSVCADCRRQDNLAGGALGAFLVPILIVEATRQLPAFGCPGLIDSLDWVAIGAILLAFLWFRPKGLLPERKRVFRPAGEAQRAPGAARPRVGLVRRRAGSP
ncbi:MAG TPA: hypothetical protein DHU96_02125 [Actinobacteria bacterium]|nr:hypothetical protein [Actinomycetota bacterium]